MSEIVRERLRKTKFRFGENTITIRASRYKKRGSEDKTSTTVFMPGFRVQGNSLAPRRLNKIFVEELNRSVISISASSNNASRISPDQEARAIATYLEHMNPTTQEFYFFAHSQRTGQAMQVAQKMESKTAGVVLLSPVELSPYAGKDLAKQIVKAAFIHIPGETAKGIARRQGGLRKITEAGVIGATMIKEMIRETLVRGPRGHLKHLKQEVENAHIKAPISIKAPTIIVIGQRDNVVPPEPAVSKVQEIFPNSHIIIHDKFPHHGMIYQEHRAITRKSKQLLEELQKSAS